MNFHTPITRVGDSPLRKQLSIQSSGRRSDALQLHLPNAHFILRVAVIIDLFLLIEEVIRVAELRVVVEGHNASLILQILSILQRHGVDVEEGFHTLQRGGRNRVVGGREHRQGVIRLKSMIQVFCTLPCTLR
eukprot:TRINITY_DN4579_c0_g1_i6.p1 TRINITY_DN4579_c0_g1~~TRINITY_DN4579_c0_g1_i6.p1  ORF type:complete len:133 (+),score=1.44 TRINITY_DN4579_c0_g1_i6:320-718(+)